MSDMNWRAIRELGMLRSRFKELLESALTPPATAMPAGASAFEPPVDVIETDTEIVVEAELPAVLPDSLEVRLERDNLVVAGETAVAPDTGGRFLRVERQRGRFQRVVPLPAPVDGEPTARLRRGVLEIRLPRVEGGRRRIAIEKRET